MRSLVSPHLIGPPRASTRSRARSRGTTADINATPSDSTDFSGMTSLMVVTMTKPPPPTQNWIRLGTVATRIAGKLTARRRDLKKDAPPCVETDGEAEVSGSRRRAGWEIGKGRPGRADLGAHVRPPACDGDPGRPAISSKNDGFAGADTDNAKGQSAAVTDGLSTAGALSIPSPHRYVLLSPTTTRCAPTCRPLEWHCNGIVIAPACGSGRVAGRVRNSAPLALPAFPSPRHVDIPSAICRAAR